MTALEKYYWFLDYEKDTNENKQVVKVIYAVGMFLSLACSAFIIDYFARK